MSIPGKKVLVPILVLVILISQIQQAQAARGTPGTQQFGFGTRIDPRGTQVDEALLLLADLHPDWLYLPVEWAAYSPTAGSQPDFDQIAVILQFAAEKQIAVILGLTDPPAWALTAQGPDPQLAAQFILALVKRCPQAVQALELFPRANTLSGWGSKPDPGAYVALLQTVNAKLLSAGYPQLLAAAGLQPLRAGAGQEQDMDDLAFLRGMYAAGGKALMPIVSMAYSDLSGSPLISPTNSRYLVFRHYEAIREVMVANDHAEGMIWITGLSLPDGSLQPEDAVYSQPDNQQHWLHQAYYQARSQLYIGVAVLQSLNAPVDARSNPGAIMLRPDGSMHPFYATLYDMSVQYGQNEMLLKPGKSKAGNLVKNRP